ncbi:MAG TPA: ABC transporter substrate-binding protein [Alphaproteobacteria bacterium]|nr:ABC transporter substrate-binding protein [Alphaproteobacteria bacterium]
MKKFSRKIPSLLLAMCILSLILYKPIYAQNLPIELTLVAQNTDPVLIKATKLIDELHVQLIEASKNPHIAERKKLLDPVISKTFNLPKMAQASIGRHWNSMNETLQKSWVDAFSDMSIAMYANRFSSYKGQYFEILAVEKLPENNAVWVKSRIVPGDKANPAVSINYYIENGQVTDVLLSGSISEIATRRSEYTSIIRNTSIDSLIQAVRQQTENLLKQ